MNDLILFLKSKDGWETTKSFSTIMDFLDSYENGDYEYMEDDICEVKIILFENLNNKKEFITLKDAYEHCNRITK